MLIDWFTVGAQALNFLILVWLMKHFLYRPILNAIDTREKKIVAELADADSKRVEAKQGRDEFQRKNEEFDRQRATLFAKAAGEANVERQRLLDDARKAADALSEKRQESLRSEAKILNKAIARRMQDEVFAVARKALMDLATVGLEERIGAVFTRRLSKLDDGAKETLGAALKTAPEPAVVYSVFEMPADERAKIQNAINETFSADIHLRFNTAPDLISGIELTANGQKVAWSIADYLTSLEKSVEELSSNQGRQASNPETAPVPKSTAKPVVPTQPAANSEPALRTLPPPKLEPEGKAKPRLMVEPEVIARLSSKTEVASVAS